MVLISKLGSCKWYHLFFISLPAFNNFIPRKKNLNLSRELKRLICFPNPQGSWPHPGVSPSFLGRTPQSSLGSRAELLSSLGPGLLCVSAGPRAGGACGNSGVWLWRVGGGGWGKAARNRCVSASQLMGRHLGRGLHRQTAEALRVWVSEPNCRNGALLTATAAMQPSVVSSAVHFKMPPLRALHSSHLAFSCWPTAHHITLWGSSVPRWRRARDPKEAPRWGRGGGRLAPLSYERLPNSRVGSSVSCPCHRSLLPITSQKKWWTRFPERAVKAEPAPSWPPLLRRHHPRGGLSEHQPGSGPSGVFSSTMGFSHRGSIP